MIYVIKEDSLRNEYELILGINEDIITKEDLKTFSEEIKYNVAEDMALILKNKCIPSSYVRLDTKDAANRIYQLTNLPAKPLHINYTDAQVSISIIFKDMQYYPTFDITKAINHLIKGFKGLVSQITIQLINCDFSAVIFGKQQYTFTLTNSKVGQGILDVSNIHINVSDNSELNLMTCYPLEEDGKFTPHIGLLCLNNTPNTSQSKTVTQALHKAYACKDYLDLRPTEPIFAACPTEFILSLCNMLKITCDGTSKIYSYIPLIDRVKVFSPTETCNLKVRNLVPFHMNSGTFFVNIPSGYIACNMRNEYMEEMSCLTYYQCENISKQWEELYKEQQLSFLEE